MVIEPPLCATCKHYGQGDLDKMACAAFPGGIPLEILTSVRDHREPYPGDDGIRYEPKEDGT